MLAAVDVPSLDDRWEEQTGGVWPEYNRHGDVLNRYWGRLDEVFPAFQFVLVDEDGELLARANTIPVRWDGSAEGFRPGSTARSGADSSSRSSDSREPRSPRSRSRSIRATRAAVSARRSWARCGGSPARMGSGR